MWVVTDFVNGEHSSQGAFPPTAAANAAEEAASRKAGGGRGESKRKASFIVNRSRVSSRFFIPRV